MVKIMVMATSTSPFWSFVDKHPIISLLGLSTIAGAVVNVVQVLRGKPTIGESIVSAAQVQEKPKVAPPVVPPAP